MKKNIRESHNIIWEISPLVELILTEEEINHFIEFTIRKILISWSPMNLEHNRMLFEDECRSTIKSVIRIGVRFYSGYAYIRTDNLSFINNVDGNPLEESTLIFPSSYIKPQEGAFEKVLENTPLEKDRDDFFWNSLREVSVIPKDFIINHFPKFIKSFRRFDKISKQIVFKGYDISKPGNEWLELLLLLNEENEGKKKGN